MFIINSEQEKKYFLNMCNLLSFAGPVIKLPRVYQNILHASISKCCTITMCVAVGFSYEVRSYSSIYSITTGKLYTYRNFEKVRNSLTHTERPFANVVWLVWVIQLQKLTQVEDVHIHIIINVTKPLVTVSNTTPRDMYITK